MQITDVFMFPKDPGHFGTKVTGHVIDISQSESSDTDSDHMPGY